jgi:hypothetical protein
MPVLLVPQTQVIPYDAERVMRRRKDMDEFRAGVVKLWNATGAGETKFGAFRNSRNYSWNENFDGLLQTYFIFPNAGKSSDSELARIAVLFRKENCQMLGSRVVWGSEWSSVLPQGIQKQDLLGLRDASSRKYDQPKSPVRLSIESFGYWGPSMSWLTEAVAGERLSAEGFIVHSDLSGLACFRENPDPEKTGGQASNQSGTAAKQISPIEKPDSFPLKKGHRQVKIRLTGTKPKAPDNWATVSGRIQLLTLPFNPVRKSAEISPAGQPFNPDKLAQTVSAEIASYVQPLKESEIKVTRREGRFVTVDRGFAYGLKIGMHLTGPDGSRLHVVRFESVPDTDDAAILLIRKESPQKPLAGGAVLQIDKTQYPAQK